MKAGWMEIGHRVKRSQDSNGVGENHRSMDALVCFARLVESALDDGVKEWIDGIPDGGSMHMNRAYDSTKRRLALGRFEDVARPNAMYVIPDPDREGKWKAVGWAKFHEKYPRSRPSIGIIDVLAQSVSLHTTRVDGIKDSRLIKIKPIALASGSAGTLNSAIEGSCSQVAIDRIILLAQRLHVITIGESPDACNVNERKRAFTRMMLRDCRHVLIIKQKCCAHQL